jgi:hypothetical protein
MKISGYDVVKSANEIHVVFGIGVRRHEKEAIDIAISRAGFKPAGSSFDPAMGVEMKRYEFKEGAGRAPERPPAGT